jgi:HK97 family phage major capsid protein
MEMKEIRNEIRQTWAEMRGMLEKQNQRMEETGVKSGLMDEAIARASQRLDSLETRLNRPTPATKGMKSEEISGFVNWCRTGVPSERKLMTVGEDTTGGYLAPVHFVGEMIRAATEYSPIRSIARVRQTSARAIQLPRKTGSISAAWTGEAESTTDTGMTFTLEEIATHKVTALVKISQEDLEDTVYDLESELQLEFAEQFGVAEGSAFITGDGTSKPEGLLTSTRVNAVDSLDDAISAIDLLALQDSLKEPYAGRGTWVMNRQTMSAIRLLTDNRGDFLWQPGLTDDVPATILGRPYLLATDMPDIAVNAAPVIFGDIYRAYVIVDRVHTEVKRLAEKYADLGVVGFIARKRVGGKVILPEAVKKLKISS